MKDNSSKTINLDMENNLIPSKTKFTSESLSKIKGMERVISKK
jgi:hypothetical protein